MRGDGRAGHWLGAVHWETGLALNYEAPRQCWGQLAGWGVGALGGEEERESGSVAKRQQQVARQV